MTNKINQGENNNEKYEAFKQNTPRNTFLLRRNYLEAIAQISDPTEQLNAFWTLVVWGFDGEVPFESEAESVLESFYGYALPVVLDWYKYEHVKEKRQEYNKSKKAEEEAEKYPITSDGETVNQLCDCIWSPKELHELIDLKNKLYDTQKHGIFSDIISKLYEKFKAEKATQKINKPAKYFYVMLKNWLYSDYKNLQNQENQAPFTKKDNGLSYHN